MKYRIFAVIALLAMVFSLAPSSALAAPQLPEYSPEDIGSRIRDLPISQDMIGNTPADVKTEPAPKAPKKGGGSTTVGVNCNSDPANIMDTKMFLILDDYQGQYLFTNFDKIAEGPLAEIWVQRNLSYAAGDPRPTPVVTCDQADYLLGEFENNIYPIEIDFYRMPDLHDGSQSLLEAWGYVAPGYYSSPTGKQIVLVSNVRDDNFYDPTYPSYIAGFYSPTFEAYFDRNVMTIDSNDWANRIGPDSARPYLYEGVFAHEYQHLLHDDADSDEENFINEGLSDWSEILVGYAPSVIGHVDAIAAKPENSLVGWGDQGDREILSDYGLALMFAEYLEENYGQEFIRALFNNTDNGISGVNSTLAGAGMTETFADVFHTFAPALYMKGSFTHPLLQEFQVNVGHPGMPNPEAFASPGAPAWGSDYHLIWGYEQVENFIFNGYPYNPLPWTTDGSALWGGTGDLIDNFAIFSATAGSTLSFDTMYDIEEFWDYGFVQVSTDNGLTWTSLANDATQSELDMNGHPNIAANLPGFTGSTGGAWVPMTFDTSAYAGQTVLFAFRYMTDWGTTEAGWYVDNVAIDGTVLFDGSSTEGLMSLNQVLNITNDYTVQLIGEKIVAGKPVYEVKTVLSGGYMSDWASFRELFDNYRQLVMVVTYDAVEGISTNADYTFELLHKGDTKK